MLPLEFRRLGTRDYAATVAEMRDWTCARGSQTRDEIWFLEHAPVYTQGVSCSESVRAGENALKAKEEGFAAGLTTNIDVLDAQRDVFAAKRNYLKARYDYILQVLALEQLAGRLDQADLDRFNQWLE